MSEYSTEPLRVRVRSALRRARIHQVIHPIIENYIHANRGKFEPYGVSLDDVIDAWIDGYAFQKLHAIRAEELRKLNIQRAGASRTKKRNRIRMEKQNESKEVKE